MWIYKVKEEFNKSKRYTVFMDWKTQSNENISVSQDFQTDLIYL